MSTDLQVSLTIPLSKRKKRGQRRTARNSDALTLLSSDIDVVRALFTQFASARAEGNQQLADSICRTLLARTEVEEISYPTALEA